MCASNAARYGLFPLAALAAALCLGACAGRPAAVAADTEGGPRFVVELSPGEHYRATTRWFIFRLPVYPQVAAWVESPDGRYLGTILVTAKAERQDWIGAPAEGRPEALPVWSHLRDGELDAVTAATSDGETLRESDLAARLAPGTYVVKLETNRSYDYNAAYTTANAGVGGQPSVVYSAIMSVGSGPVEATFEPLGTGSVDGSDGSVREGLTGIDTALRLFSRMTVSYRE